ncbi:MAG: WGR domain-containing protein [Hyphomicrobiales bacterium]|uniref:WGR domain-containing protein n=1 Tax=Roseibium polysiphoniae TaxID=2571221 RepID=UPI003297C995
MMPTTDRTFLTRVDASHNVARFYWLSIEPDLFGGYALQRSWGRLGTWGQTRSSQVHDLETARSHINRLAMQKLRRGYVVDGQQ